MNLVIDIGNTHTKLAWFEQGKLVNMLRYEAGSLTDINDLLNKNRAERAIVSSVGILDPKLIKEVKKKYENSIILDHKTPLPFHISYKTPHTLGHDRIAAAAGALFFYPGHDVLIIDMGTAITIDFITAAGEYLGGNISPGLNTRFRALNEFTAKLPLVSGDPKFPEFGTDTRTAIAAGVQQGIIFEIDRYMYDFARVYPNCEYMITGGDANFFVSKLNSPIFAVPELVLTGLNFILEYNLSGNLK